MCLFLQTYCSTVNTHTCTKRIRISNLMTHNNNFVSGHNKLSKCLSLNTRLHSCILRCLLLLTTKISYSVTILNNCLISASGKCKIDCHTRILVAQRIRCRIQSQTNTQCCWSWITDINLFYLFQKRKLIFFQLFISILSKYDKVFILLQFLYDTIYISDILIDLTVDQCHKKGLSDFLNTLHNFIIVININQSGNHSLIFVLSDVGIQFCYIS